MFEPFRPALIVVDYQYDFCPPDGPLAVPDALSLLPTLNHLLSQRFTLKLATRDWHPIDHTSFTSNHPELDQTQDQSAGWPPKATVPNPFDPEQTEVISLWPDHCVRDTRGADLIDELHRDELDAVIDKGTHRDVEMLSGFASVFASPSTGVGAGRTAADAGHEELLRTGLLRMLRDAGITHVYFVGLAMDYCVMHTAIDAARFGFETFVVREGTKAIDGSVEGLRRVETECEGHRVKFIQLNGEEVGWVERMRFCTSP